MFDTLTPVLQSYTRAFVAQGVGIIGLAWCLVGAQAGFAVLLTVLVLIDQGIFLRGRTTTREAGNRAFPPLAAWCVAISGLDILLCAAAVVRSAGLRDGVGGPEVTGVLDSLAYVVACFAHGPTNLAPMTAAGRLAGGMLAGLGAVAFLAGLAAIAIRLRRHA